MFTTKYNLKKCLYFEICEDMEQAIVREKQLKNLSRKEKITLVENENPNYEDLYTRLTEYSDPELRL